MNYMRPGSTVAHEHPMKMCWADVSTIKLRNRRLRKHPQWQVDKIVASIRLYGFNVPILIDEDGFIVSGEARYQAALALGLKVMPVKGREYDGQRHECIGFERHERRRNGCHE